MEETVGENMAALGIARQLNFIDCQTVDALIQRHRFDRANPIARIARQDFLNFLLRYPALAPSVLDRLDPADARLHLADDDRADPANAEAPMIRYKYGPWDDRYYPVIGALVSRGLLRYARGRRGSVALAPTLAGRALARQLGAASEWNEIADRSRAIADASSGLTGNALKDLIYDRLAALMDRPHRETIQ